MSDILERGAETLALARLEPWLKAHVAGFEGPLSASKFAGGQSNPTYRLDAAGGPYVLRRKPPGKLLKSAHAVDREYRVMQALKETDVPVADPLALCEDESVIGSMFYVMAFREGRVFWDPALPDLSPPERGAVYDEMNRVLAALHSVDPQTVGLGDFGRPGSYFARQVSRWSRQYRDSETESIADMDALIAWVEANVPADDGRVALVHGDYRIDNLIFAPDAPRVIAVVDWELATLGHPHSDLAYQCMQWRLPHEGGLRGLAGLDRAALGIPVEEAYVARYCERRGLSGIDDWTFCLAFSFFRIAAILQGVKKRALDGTGSNPEQGLKMGLLVPLIARTALQLIEDDAR
ncbi:aminoglycoside phosphotransferase (APT) family kinase protein [Breoghania corrubedonensis]|uniref:Aminoglycoside phosphotransferase (APT) family kinase protein n=1 Tax=Breoghania corrubedonensis TaxID=665038 RepID=A0A2T5V6N2_9HYPH|nr:phosphotransferase family protein [Breoghania corrubedonensis]PTW59409.1 aminoglycoside phosphotransferase (APT) family kinase protein [Breoghania corrubedonensis]